jgi:hypothetical protein
LFNVEDDSTRGQEGLRDSLELGEDLPVCGLCPNPFHFIGIGMATSHLIIKHSLLLAPIPLGQVYDHTITAVEDPLWDVVYHCYIATPLDLELSCQQLFFDKYHNISMTVDGPYGIQEGVELLLWILPNQPRGVPSYCQWTRWRV